MGVYGSPEMHPNLNNASQTENIQSYVKDDNMPMTYFYIYIFVKFPFNVLLPAILSFTTWLSPGMILYYALTSIAEAIACIGLYARKYWGYMFNKIYIIISGIWCALLLCVSYVTKFESASVALLTTGYFLLAVIIHIFSFIYFEKRKHMFIK